MPGAMEQGMSAKNGRSLRFCLFLPIEQSKFISGRGKANIQRRCYKARDQASMRNTDTVSRDKPNKPAADLTRQEHDNKRRYSEYYPGDNHVDFISKKRNTLPLYE